MSPYDQLQKALTQHVGKPQHLYLSTLFDHTVRRHMDFRKHFSYEDGDTSAKRLMGLAYTVDPRQTESIRIE